mmetsp:Transcript_55126/g.112058  ORF Transcript_55126/g.112058 Transcript_55126/m.112058 type:complete len:277 (-) Transcript_55126:1444-2274(-)
MSQVSYDGANKVDIEALKKAEEDRKAAEPIDVSDGGAKLLLLQTQAALAARRFEDMATFITKYCRLGLQPSRATRNMLAIAYKTLVGRLRSALRVLDHSSHPDEATQAELDHMRAKAEKEMRSLCTTLLGLIDEHLLAADKMPLGRVFYLKLAGDFSRYLCEISRGDARNEHAMEAERFYALALEAACNNKIRVTNVVRLGLALNTALFCDEILHQPEKALKIAQEAFSLAMAEVTTLQNPEFSDATRLMALLDDNITMWSSNNASAPGADVASGK